MDLRLPISLILASRLLAAHSMATDYHVSTTGSDTHPGTLAQPWRTIQKAADSVVAGDVVHIHAGTYAERVSLQDKDGTLAQPIVFQTYPGDSARAAIDQSGVTPPDGLSALFAIGNCDHIILRNLELANYKTAGTNAQQRAQTPVGLHITGDGAGIRILGCLIHDIWQSSATLNNFEANGFGIAVYGTAADPIDGLVIDDCEVHSLRTGASESVAINGNVTHFQITRNRVHDCNNIGIDFIGFEGTNTDTTLDQARNGVCTDNEVWAIDSKFNPAYGGNFTTGGGNATRSAPGLYVDGGRDILLERNHVHGCNFAVSVGSENTGRLVTGVTVRNNLLHHCHVGGIVIGGSASTNGGASGCTFRHNTIYDNDTTGSGGGQVMIQHHVSTTIITRNIIASTSGFAQLVLKDNTTGSITADAIDWNLYQTSPGASLEFIWNGVAQSTFAGWKNAGALAKDSHSSWITTSLGLSNAAPASGSPATDFALTATSPARDAGDSVALPFVAASGEKDHFGQSRIAQGRVDIGADEYLGPIQSWRELHFALPDGGGDADDAADPDHDGSCNLVEYSQGMNPTLPDPQLLPKISRVDGALHFTFRKAAAELSYVVQQSQDLSGWTPTTLPIQSIDTTHFRVVLPEGSPVQFMRLRVAP